MTKTLPTDAKARKGVPVYSGFVKYFPDAIAAVAELSFIANEQHNPGEPLHWDRAKSGDELDAQMRHVLDMASGTEMDTDGVLHATKNAWRAMAGLQKLIESRRAAEPEAVSTDAVTAALKLHPEAVVVAGWFPWRAGPDTHLPPSYPKKIYVDVRFLDGDVTRNTTASTWNWTDTQGPGTIVAWRHSRPR